MCGILLIWGADEVVRTAGPAGIAALKARGPDVEQLEFLDIGNGLTMAIGFTRLHIQGADASAEQPFRMIDGRIVMCNGEIFNSEILKATLNLKTPDGSSDCAVIPALLERGMSLAEVSRQLDGDFAIVVVDSSAHTISVSRDPYGVRPLFYGEGKGWKGFASEIKGLPENAGIVQAVEPGSAATHMIDRRMSQEQWHEVPWLKTPYWRASLEGLTAAGTALRHAFEEAVYKRMATVRGLGACLSGGLDSSLVAAVAARRLAAQGKRLHTYSVGMSGSPDLEHARLVAEHIGSIHHERLLTPEECLATIPTVVRAIESFDITTVRASVGNYLVGELVTHETPDVKVVLNGDGADEVLGGYLYMRAAPDDAAFETETDRLLREIHRYDVLRSERSMAAHGLESRSPFLDRQFISVARGLPTEVLRPRADLIEKSILRTAFAESGLLPDKVLWRRKEAFSDGISRAEKSWFEMARVEGEKRAGGDWSSRAASYTVNPPPTAEALWYRELFHENYPEAAAAAAAPAMWMPRFIVGATDPSARTLSLYTESSPSIENGSRSI
jgi:asparagine synthase (glutamine-hydrolysing)